MYKALRTMKVKGADGTMRLVQHGDPVPEAADWRNLRAYLDRGWVCKDDETPKAAKPADVTVDVALPEAPPESGDIDTEEDANDGGYSRSELMRLSKSELQVLAETLGVDPDQNKPELAEAVLAAQ